MRKLMEWEAAELVRQKTGLRLWSSNFTTSTVIDERPERPYLCVLYGPYFDVVEDMPNYDTRVFVCYRLLEDSLTLQLLIQDADDDVFLHHNAEGVEKFDIGTVWVS